MSSHFRVKSAALLQLRPMSLAKRWVSAMCWALLVGRECVALPLVPFVGPTYLWELHVLSTSSRTPLATGPSIATSPTTP